MLCHMISYDIISYHIAHAHDMFLFQSSPSKLLCLDRRLDHHMVKVTGGFDQVILPGSIFHHVSPIPLWEICPH